MTEEKLDSFTIQDEFEALQKLINTLQEFDNDKKKKLLEMVYKFFEIKPKGSNAIDSDRYKVNQNINSVTYNSDFSTDRSLNPKEFLLEKDPKTDVEKVACLAYYLTHYRETQHFKTIDISKLNTEAAQIKFSNTAVAVDNATKQGYLVQAVKGHKQLSAIGEMFVQALPDRDAAKEIMKGSRPRRKSRKKAKTTKKDK